MRGLAAQPRLGLGNYSTLAQTVRLTYWLAPDRRTEPGISQSELVRRARMTQPGCRTSELGGTSRSPGRRAGSLALPGAADLRFRTPAVDRLGAGAKVQWPAGSGRQAASRSAVRQPLMDSPELSPEVLVLAMVAGPKYREYGCLYGE